MIYSVRDGCAAVIYALWCPRDETIRYIGKTEIGLDCRLDSHLSPARGSSKHDRWMRSLAARGCKPVIRALEYVEEQEEIYNREQWRIDWALSRGLKLVNDDLRLRKRLRNRARLAS